MLLAVARTWSQVASGLLFLFTSIAITPTEFGQFAIATSIYGALAVCVGQGTSEYVMKTREQPDAAPTVFFLNMATASLASVAALLIGALVPLFINGEQIPRILLFLTPVFFLSALTLLMESVVMKRGAVGQVARANLVADTVSLLAALGSLALGAGVFSLVAQRVVREFTIMVSYSLFSRWKPRFAFDRHLAKEAIRFARIIVGSRIVGLGGTAIVDLTIGAFLGPKEAGIYRLGGRLLTIATDVLYQPFRAALWVRLPPVQHDAPAFRKTAVELLGILGLGMFAAMTGMALVADPLLRLFFKPEWQSAAPLIAMMAFARVVSIPGMASEVVFALRNQMRFLMQFTIITVVAAVLTAFVAARYGIVVFVAVNTLVTLSLQIYLLPALMKGLDIQMGDFLLVFGKLASNAAVMTAVVAVVLLAEEYANAPLWFRLVSAVVAGALSYILAARRFTPTAYAAYASGLEEVCRATVRLVRRTR